MNTAEWQINRLPQCCKLLTCYLNVWSHIISQPWLIFWPVLCRSHITLHNHTYTRCSLLICPIFCACIIQNYILLDQSHKMTSYLAIVLDISYSTIEHFLYVPGPGICGVKGWPGVTWVRGFLQNCLDSAWRWGGAKNHWWDWGNLTTAGWDGWGCVCVAWRGRVVIQCGGFLLYTIIKITRPKKIE